MSLIDSFARKNVYSREEAKRLKETFWTKYGQYMSPIPSDEGTKVNWLNYKTGVKHLYFRLDADNKSADIYIEISNPDAGLRELVFEQFLAYKSILHSELKEEWIWDPLYYDASGKATARIGCRLNKKLSVFKQEDWSELISFFKPRMVALDRFWSTAKHGFDVFK